MVSVLFADLVGFTRFTDSHDPEDVRAILTRFYEQTAAIVAAFGGETEKYVGDAVLAVWGARTTGEDDAERAVRAGLEIVDSVNALADTLDLAELAARVAVQTGEALIADGGNDGTGMVVGTLVNTASRLQATAAPRTVVVDEATRLLTEASISYVLLGDVTIRGVARPVTASRALRVHAQRRGVGRRVSEPPFVDRQQELRVLKAVIHGYHDGLQLVSVIGDAGIGKSRLLDELLRYVDGLSTVYFLHQGRCPAYGRSNTFWPLADMVRQRARIAETDGPHEARTLLSKMLAENVGDHADREWLGPHIAGLLGLEEMPIGDQAECFAAWRKLFEWIARRGPTLMIVDDLHRADDRLLEFIDDLCTSAASAPIIVITLARPSLLHRRPRWAIDHPRSLSLRLPLLGDEAVNELIDSARPQLDRSIAAAIAQRSQGLPLVAVEFVRFARDGNPVDGDRIPDSLAAVQGARIDSLDPDSRSLLYDAAVLGQSFSPRSLDALRLEPTATVNCMLDDLVQAEILEVDMDWRSPRRGQYHFVPSLIRDVAYGRIPRRDRFKRHLAVARHLEELEDPTLSGIVASHYLDALQSAGVDETESIVPAVLDAVEVATRRAMALHAHPAVVALVDRIERLTLEPSDRFRFVIRAAQSAATYDSEEALDRAKQAVALADQLDSEPERLQARALLVSLDTSESLVSQLSEQDRDPQAASTGVSVAE